MVGAAAVVDVFGAAMAAAGGVTRCAGLDGRRPLAAWMAALRLGREDAADRPRPGAAPIVLGDGSSPPPFWTAERGRAAAAVSGR